MTRTTNGLSGLLLTLLPALSLAACASSDASLDTDTSDGSESEVSSVKPGWPPQVDTANKDWMPKGAGNPRRSMPGTYVATWMENGVKKQRQLLSFSNHADDDKDEASTPINERTSMQMLWRDVGDTGGWHLARKRLGSTIDWSKGLHDTEPGAAANFANIYEKDDAQRTLVIISARPAFVSGRGWQLVRHESTDHGVSWESAYSPLTVAAGVSPGIVHQGITVANVNGVKTLFAPMYYRNEGSYYRMTATVIKSTDEGKSWSYQGTIAEQTPWCPSFKSDPNAIVRPLLPPADPEHVPVGNGFNEATVSVTRSGKLLAVVRCDQWFLEPQKHVRSYLYKSISSNNGVDWSLPTRIDIPNTAPGPDSIPVYGVSPKLVPMAGGALMLAFGRPGNMLAFNSTGEGDRWETIAGWPKVKRWDNAPDVPGYAPEGRLWSHHGSSGYMGVAKLSENQFMVVGDNCQADWGCGYPPPGGAEYPKGKDYLLWNLLVSYIPN